MSYYLLILKRNIMLVVSCLSFFLCLASVVIMSRAVKVSQSPILIAIDSNGTRVISRSDDPIFDTEAIQFSRIFVSKLYNFTPKTFEENVGYASTFFSIKLWQDEEAKFLELMKNVDKEQITMNASIERIIKNSSSEYTLDVKIKEITRLNTQDKHISLKLFLERRDRSKSNPFGIEVARYEENIIN